MLVPVVKKITENRRCFMERVFPVGGIWGEEEILLNPSMV